MFLQKMALLKWLFHKDIDKAGLKGISDEW